MDVYVREQRGLTEATTARRLACLGGFYERALDERLLARNPVARMRRPRVGEESPRLGLSRGQVAALLEAGRASGARRARATSCSSRLFYNGLRVSEALALDVADVGEDGGQSVLALRCKGNKRARAPINAAVYAAIRQAVGARPPPGPCWPPAAAGGWTARPRGRSSGGSRGAPESSTPSAPTRCGTPFVTLALDAGVSLRDVQDAAGHADPRTTRRYDRARHRRERHPTRVLAGLTPPRAGSNGGLLERDEQER